MAIAAAIASAIFWYRGAEAEKIPPLYWVGPSLCVSAVIIVGFGGGWIAALIGQAALFVAITAYRVIADPGEK